MLMLVNKSTAVSLFVHSALNNVNKYNLWL